MEDNELIMNNQIDISKLTPREKLSLKISLENNIPHSKKQLLFLKR